jgi:hypothetical protein
MGIIRSSESSSPLHTKPNCWCGVGTEPTIARLAPAASTVVLQKLSSCEPSAEIIILCRGTRLARSWISTESGRPDTMKGSITEQNTGRPPHSRRSSVVLPYANEVPLSTLSSSSTTPCRPRDSSKVAGR